MDGACAGRNSHFQRLGRITCPFPHAPDNPPVYPRSRPDRMLFKHAALYSFARGIPGVVNFLALALYTRLLLPAEYGRYALVVAWAGIANAVLFQWLRSAARRFQASYRNRPGVLLASLSASYLGMAGIAGLGAIVLLLTTADPHIRLLIGLATIMLWTQAFFELGLELVVADLDPSRYGKLATVKAAGALCLGGLLAYLGFGAAGVVVGVSVGFLLPGLEMLRKEWRGTRPSFREQDVFRTILHFGIPLSATFVLDFVINSSDRILLGRLQGTADVGMYAVSYDLTQQGLYALMVVLYLAAFPLAVHALESGGTVAAQAVLRRHAALLVSIALPAAVGLIILSGNVASVILGAQFRGASEQLIPLIAVAAFLAGMKAFYFDLSFQLGRLTYLQLWVSGSAAALNVVLNLWWIPSMGMAGAAYATITSFGVGLTLSIWLGRRAFPLPAPFGQWSRIVAATAMMAAAVMAVAAFRGPLALIGQTGLGVAVYGCAAILLDINGVRAPLLQRFRRSN